MLSNVPHLSQSIVLNAYNDPEYPQQKKEKYEILKKRYEAVKKTLSEHPEYKEYFEALPYNSGYFMCVKVKVDAEKVRQILLEKYDTGIIVLGEVIRVAYSAAPVTVIEELFANMYNACKEV